MMPQPFCDAVVCRCPQMYWKYQDKKVKMVKMGQVMKGVMVNSTRSSKERPSSTPSSQEGATNGSRC
jgi:hypothetical protein